MKTRMLLLAGIIMLVLSAQSQNYMLAVTSGTYTDLVGATSLNQGQVWDDPEYTIPIGFSFPFWWQVYDTIHIGDGYCYFSDGDTVIVAYGADLIDRGDSIGISQSSIGYVLGGTSQNILKIEWKNVGFYNERDLYGTLNWYVNIQLWLYENGSWEVIIGPSDITEPQVAFDGNPGPSVGYGEANDSYWLTGMAGNPSLTHYTNFNFGNLSSVPANGTIYQFNPYINSVPGTEQMGFLKTSPNPVISQLILSVSEPGMMELFDLAGRLVISENIPDAGTRSVDLSSCPEGIYILQFTSGSGVKYAKKVVKQ